jgi:hypothetical protein
MAQALFIGKMYLEFRKKLLKCYRKRKRTRHILDRIYAGFLYITINFPPTTAHTDVLKSI